MSKPFETELANWVVEEFERQGVVEGDRYRAEFPDKTTADEFAAAVYERIDSQTTKLEYEGESEEIVTFEVGGTPVHFVRVQPSGGDVRKPYEVSRWYSSTLRTILSVNDELDSALFLVLEEGVSIETLNAVQELFVDDDLCSLSAFKSHLYDEPDDLDMPGRAVMESLQELLIVPDRDRELLNNFAPLRRYCEALAACRSKDVDKLAELPPRLTRVVRTNRGPFMREDGFEGWFDKNVELPDLKDQFDQIIEENEEMAGRIAGCLSTIKDERSELSAHFNDEFVEKVLISQNWQTEISRTDAIEGLIQDGEGDGTIDENKRGAGKGTSGTGKSKTSKGSSSGSSPTPTLESSEFVADDSRVVPGSDNGNEWQHIIGKSDGSFELTVTFSSTIKDEPIRFRTPGTDDSSAYTVSGDTLTISESGLDPAEPSFYQLEVYLGHKRRMGTPACQFSIAMVPDWFFDALEDEVYRVDQEHKALAVTNGTPINLTPPSTAEDADRIVRDLTASNATITLESPLFIRPKPVAGVERVEAQITTPDAKVPVSIHFLSGEEVSTESEVVFPLSLETIINPEDWDSAGLRRGKRVIINTARGQITSPTREPFNIPEADHRLLQFEETIRQNESIAPREIASRDITDSGTGTVKADTLDDISDSLLDAYDELFDHFQTTDTTPSTSVWGEDLCSLVERVLNEFLAAFDSFQPDTSPYEFGAYRRLGTVESTVADKVWLTPYHPLMLAYGLQVARWRDQLVEEGNTAGFKSNRFNPLFSPAGLYPYRWSEDQKGVLTGQEVGNQHLWVAYSPPEGYGTETPKYLDSEVENKLSAFHRAFPALFEIHPERELVINMVSLGDLAKALEGLYDFYKFTENYDQIESPKIKLRLYGGKAEGEALEQFFATDTDSRLATELEKRDSRNGLDIVDLIHNRVTFVHEPGKFETNAKPAHLTFFRGILDDDIGELNTDADQEGTRVSGLLPREIRRVQTMGAGTVSKTGVVLNDSSPFVTSRVGHAINAMEAGVRNAGLDRTKTLCKVVKFENQDLRSVWEHSLWVSHIEPQVDLDFYIKSSAEGTGDGQGALMIHYSDQYDSQPGFDVITLTNKRDPYLQALRRELTASPGLDEIDPNTVLTRLVAIDGELALDIQKAEGNSVTELLGFIGGLAVTSHLLERDRPDYEWIPISLREFARHDRQYRRSEDGLLQYTEGGDATDDLCFVGIPTDPEDTPELKLWLVEAKGGSAKLSKGASQIRGGKRELDELFHPEEDYSDTQILYSEFGNIVSQIARRLYYYGVIGEEQIEAIRRNEDDLLEGTYDLGFLRDPQGAIGDVIRIRPNIAIPTSGYDEDVRTIELPLEAIQIINEGEDVPSFISNLDVGFDREPDDSTSGGQTPGAKQSGENEDEPEGSSKEGPSDTEEDEAQSDNDENEADSAAEEPVTTESDSEAEEEQESDNKASETTSDRSEGNSVDSDDSPVGEDTNSGVSVDNGAYGEYRNQILQSLTETTEPTAELDPGKLTSSLHKEFQSLGVDIHPPNPADVSVGPRKVGVNIHPKEGQKVPGILNNLDSISVHIQASGAVTGVPVPAKGAVRLEIPHGKEFNVTLRSAFEKSGEELSTPLHIPLGVTTEMEHRTLDLLEEHHLLIAGATGSGKSNFLSTVICGLALANTPEAVQMTILDPKALDFGRFKSLPHVDRYIDDDNEAAAYLTELLDTEVEERRAKLQEVSAASVQEYNRLSEKLGKDPLPYRVIIIDEYADLTMAVDDRKKLESAVTRLAQIGRALGYSILLATQRPDAEIVSGNIKTNFQSRIAFELPTGTDSRVILDKNGAEDLQGAGDMIASTRKGDEYHVQAYYLPPEDAIEITSRLEAGPER
jgi:hypothetical protein